MRDKHPPTDSDVSTASASAMYRPPTETRARKRADWQMGLIFAPVGELLASDDLEDSRETEKRVSYTQFSITLWSGDGFVNQRA